MFRLTLRSFIRALSSTRLSSQSYHTAKPPHRRRNNVPHYSRRRNHPGEPPPLDHGAVERVLSHLPKRYTPSDFVDALSRQRDPRVCVHLLHWASQQPPRLRPGHDAHLIAIKKLGAAAMYSDMDYVASQALSAASLASEELCNTLIYFYTEARMLSRAIGVYRRMRDDPSPEACRPTLRTYNLLFAALLGREGGNSYISHVYMDNISCLFRQMVNSGIEPDITAVNSLIRGYVLSLHVNDALRVFHQMGVAYTCPPNDQTYNHLVHGLCAQGRTENARELIEEMKGKGFIPGQKAYNSLASALALSGKVNAALEVVREMAGRRRVEELTYRTMLGEMGRQGRAEEALGLLREWRANKLVDERCCIELMQELQEEYDIDSNRLGNELRRR